MNMEDETNKLRWYSYDKEIYRTDYLTDINGEYCIVTIISPNTPNSFAVYFKKDSLDIRKIGNHLALTVAKDCAEEHYKMILAAGEAGRETAERFITPPPQPLGEGLAAGASSGAEIQAGKKEIDLGKHYKFTFQGLRIDPYRIFRIYGIGDPCQQHAIKKLLRAGCSIKSLEQDIDETILTLKRWKEILQEDKS